MKPLLIERSPRAPRIYRLFDLETKKQIEPDFPNLDKARIEARKILQPGQRIELAWSCDTPVKELLG